MISISCLLFFFHFYLTTGKIAWAIIGYDMLMPKQLSMVAWHLPSYPGNMVERMRTLMDTSRGSCNACRPCF